MPGQRLLAKLDLFKDPEVVLADERYWTPDFVRHFVEAWDGVAYLDPRAGKRVAEVAVKLVSLLDDDDAQQVLRPRALATLGSSHRALGHHAKAEEILSEVRQCHTTTLVPRLDEADYCRRMTYLRMDERRFAEALDFADKTILLCRAEQAEHELGRAYAARGAVYLWMTLSSETVPSGEPIASLSEALRRVDPRRGSHTFEGPTCNLARALLEGCPCDLRLTLKTLKKAARLQAKNRITRKTLPNAQLQWNIGLVHLRLGDLYRAGEILRRARRVLLELGLAEQAVCISLDLARVYAALGHWGRLRVLVEEILGIEGGYTREGLAALEAWHRAILQEQVTRDVWRQVLETVRWVPLAPARERERHPITLNRPRSPRAPRLW